MNSNDYSDFESLDSKILTFAVREKIPSTLVLIDLGKDHFDDFDLSKVKLSNPFNVIQNVPLTQLSPEILMLSKKDIAMIWISNKTKTYDTLDEVNSFLNSNK